MPITTFVFRKIVFHTSQSLRKRRELFLFWGVFVGYWENAHIIKVKLAQGDHLTGINALPTKHKINSPTKRTTLNRFVRFVYGVTT
jgi:hypothetical protein